MYTPPRSAAALALALAAAAASAADDPTARGFDPDPVRPAFSIGGDFAVETAGTAPRGVGSVDLLFQYAHGLLSVRQDSARDDLLRARFSASVTGTLSLGAVELGASLPVALWQDADFSFLTSRNVGGALVAPVSRTALGDLRLGAKAPLVRQERAPIGLAALLEVRAPTGDKQAFTGDGPMVIPGLVASRRFGKLRVDAQAGYAIRQRGQYMQLVVHDGLVWGAGACYDLPRLGRIRSRAIAEVTGSWPRGDELSTDRYRAALSARGGLRAFLTRYVALEVGGGAGLGTPGYGREAWRVFGGIRITPEPGSYGEPGAEAWEADRDGDGVPDSEDACPDEPGPAELDGCPDRDHDGIPDREDKCPDQPGPAVSDGCPPKPGEPLVSVETERLSLKDAIQFDTAKDSIRKPSYQVLDEIAAVLTSHPDLRRIRIEGHTDDVGGIAYNQDLSERRARSVVRYLVAKGIAAERLAAAGFGKMRPIASNRTALGRAKNRRVEFAIVEEDRVKGK